jgi:hypothetical protein
MECEIRAENIDRHVKRGTRRLEKNNVDPLPHRR